jgi:hypothetical protein
LRSVLACSPRPFAKLRTQAGLTTATAISAAHSAATTWRCSPPVASTTTNCASSARNLATSRLMPAGLLASVTHSALGRTATTSSALLTSIPTYTSSVLPPRRPAPPCAMRARALGAALSTVRATDPVSGGRGDPCSRPVSCDLGPVGLPRPLLSLYAGSQIQGHLGVQELHRLKGEAILRRDPSAAAQAEACFRKAIEIARGQSVKWAELRSTVSLARLLRNTNRRDEARAMLAEIYNWFTEGFDTADLREAKELLEQLNKFTMMAFRFGSKPSI